ncbi:MAG TPA: diphosphomevalonate decarboxylase [Balneolaceae bacterium]|nr:diphosphomevalonate decarboxylase [Balneolaceae bacterium]
MKRNSGQGTTKKTCATAIAHANIALIKYWGKRQGELNLPAVGSISLTLDSLGTETTIHFDSTLKADHFELNGKTVSGSSLQRLSNFLDCVDSARPYAAVASTNNFPTAAGLASSASGFAALALSASVALGQNLSRKALSKLARQGSGSAARSVYGGFVEMKCGNDPSGMDDFASPLFDEDYWDVRMLIAITSTEKKPVGSTQGMNHTARTSPYYDVWLQSQPADLKEMRAALQAKDFEKVGELMEYSCFKMHGLAMSARPALLYWNEATIEVIRIIRDLRRNGTAAYVTVDAGPQVKILCLPETIDDVKQALETVKGVKEILACRPGPAAAIKSLEKA